MNNPQSSKLHSFLNDPDEFALTFELIPGRGGRSCETSRVLTLAEKIAADGRIRAVSITENAGGHPALSPGALGREGCRHRYCDCPQKFRLRGRAGLEIIDSVKTRVSVVIPTRNTRDMTLAAVKSLQVVIDQCLFRPGAQPPDRVDMHAHEGFLMSKESARRLHASLLRAR